jgi:tetratricopeptide (TPR) repeat protein
MNPSASDFRRTTWRVPTLILVALAWVVVSGAPVAAQDDPDTSQQAIDLFNKGQDAHEKGDLAAAIENYEKALKLMPEFPEAELQRGNAYQALGKLPEAEKAFKRAVALREDWSLGLASLGAVLVREQRFADAESFLSKAIEIDELNFPAYTALTELRLSTNSSREELLSLLARIRALTAKANPTASIWASRAAIEAATGDRKNARASALRALEIDPRSTSALSTAADVALLENDPSAADDYLKRLEAVMPNSEAVKGIRARILVGQGKSDDAIKLLDSIANPGRSIIELKKQIVASTTNDTAELEKQVVADPKNGIILGKLCSAYRTTDPVRALDYCRRAAEASPDDLQPVIGYAAALVQNKNYDQAVNVLRKLIAVAPDNSTARANLATALFQLKRYPEAKMEFRWLTDHQPDRAIAYYFLAIVHDQMDEYGDAAANYQQFLRLADPVSSKLEIEKVNLRLPIVQRLIKEGKGKRRG